MIGELRSYINTFKVFRPFFSLKRIIFEAIFFPLEYLRAKPFFLPSSISFFITHACNLKCECCFDNDYRKQKSMPVSDFEAFVNNLGKNYKPSIFFSGGEPFLHNNILDFFKICTQKKLTFGVVTNGTIFTENMQAKISECMPAVVIFSVHGSCEVHDKVVGLSGSFAKMCDNVTHFLAYTNPPKIVFNFILHKESYNATDLKLFIDQISKRNIFPDEIRFNHLNYVLPIEQNAQNACKYMNNLEQVKYRLNKKEQESIFITEETLLAFNKVLEEYKNIYMFSFKPYLSNEDVLKWYNEPFCSQKRKCLFPLKSLSIDSDGKVFFCQKISFENPDIHDFDIKRIWFSKEANVFRRYLRKGLFPVCHRCCKL